MIQDIIDGIIKAIRTQYDDSFKIYTESVEQGLVEPCFSIVCLNGQNVNGICRKNRTYPFNITYFPSSTDEPRQECLNVLESLYDIFDVIEVGTSKLRGTGMSGDIIDGVLQFQVTYALFLMATKAETIMENLGVKTDGTDGSE